MANVCRATAMDEFHTASQAWFAWRPVKLVSGRWVWLRRVELCSHCLGWTDDYWYRNIGDKTPDRLAPFWEASR